MAEELFLFLRKLQSGPVDLSEPLALASRSGGLIGDRRDCAMKIIDAVQCACLQWEAISRENRDRTTVRERLDERQVAIEKMHLLARQLEADTWKIERIQGSFEQSIVERKELGLVVNAIRDAAGAIDLFTERQRQLIHCNGGNRKGFDHLFVPKMRSVWTKITGKDPGVARTAVVSFSESVWLVFGFEPRRPRPLFPWLSERFSKIR
jgi:hypothetical protein